MLVKIVADDWRLLGHDNDAETIGLLYTEPSGITVWNIMEISDSLQNHVLCAFLYQRTIVDHQRYGAF